MGDEPCVVNRSVWIRAAVRFVVKCPPPGVLVIWWLLQDVGSRYVQ